ncbi:MAG: hypothetical protein VW809_01150 [Deltaproteobacteria bacterium]|jgi:hypothetical protein|nr:hypothetical protein [SAR324 cluster bacterium]MEC8684688.1 hypothetical protein [SAR324 cluster bacterium]NBR19600.1 hypothetical protein [Pseudomonadota bacterium]|tara:strand:+ start:2659 stop:3186 length:528 start_codon:yes stop_codon:yes gene_type:complete
MEVEIAQKHNQKSDAIRQISGLVFLTVAIIFIFNVIDLFFGLDENLAKKNAVVEENEKMISTLPKGRLNFFESQEGHKLSKKEYEAVCKNTKIVTQRAVMGANITNKLAQQVYMNNGNLVVESFVKWENDAEACYAGYTLNGVVDGKEHSIKISGQAKGFLKTSIDTRVYFIKNY